MPKFKKGDRIITAERAVVTNWTLSTTETRIWNAPGVVESYEAGNHGDYYLVRHYSPTVVTCYDESELMLDPAFQLASTPPPVPVPVDDTLVFRAEFKAFWDSLSAENKRGYFNKTARRLAQEQTYAEVQRLLREEIKEALKPEVTAKVVEEALGRLVDVTVKAVVTDLTKSLIGAMGFGFRAKLEAALHEKVQKVVEGLKA